MFQIHSNGRIYWIGFIILFSGLFLRAYIHSNDGELTSIQNYFVNFLVVMGVVTLVFSILKRKGKKE